MEVLMKLAIFDFDGTLLMKDTLPCLGKEWLRQKRSKARYITTVLLVLPVVLLYKARLLSRETMKGLAFRRFNRLFTDMTRQEIETFFLNAYPHLYELFNAVVLDEIKLAQERGFHCVLLSGAYIELLQIVSKDLGINTVIGAKLAYKDDVFDQKGDTPFIDGMTKQTLLLKAFADEEVDWESSIAFGDSYTDICVIETVGERVAVNPDAELLLHAQTNSWRVVQG
jgi:HAD superfamily phosphoserine phosphatase-like hydrolase